MSVRQRRAAETPAPLEAAAFSESKLGQWQRSPAGEGEGGCCQAWGPSLTSWCSPEGGTCRATLTRGLQRRRQEGHSLTHGWTWQGLSSRSGPRQGIPTPDGAGSVQKRCRFWRPRPQEAEHSLQGVQADQWPFTARGEPRRASVVGRQRGSQKQPEIRRKIKRGRFFQRMPVASPATPA